MDTDKFQRSYADFGVGRSLRQARHALAKRRHVDRDARGLVDSMALPEERIERLLGEPLEGKRILEVGPGQSMERSRYFARKNEVIAMDRDVIETGQGPALYWRMARTNGVGRAVKSAGKYLLIGRAREAEFNKIVGNGGAPPTFLCGDIQADSLEAESFDVVVSWSVFEHLPDPRKALENLIDSLKPGGVLHISIHVFTAHDGHHDIRAFTGAGESLPLWGHLRPTKQDEIRPSSYLNEWRIGQWTELFAELTPGADEYLDEYEVRERFGPRLTPELRAELQDYTDEELFTVNAVYTWQKPA